MADLRKQYGLIGPGPQGKMPEPSFPSYLRQPDKVDELMPAARAAVTQSGGRTPLGLAKEGEILLIPVGWNADPLVQEAIVRAFKERNIEARILYENDMAGVKKADLEAIKKAEDVFTAGDGQQEPADWFFQTIPDQEKAINWVKERDPDLHKASWPEIRYPEERLKKVSDEYDDMVKESLITYLDQHPEVSKVFWRTGGRTNTQKMLRQHGQKFTGNYTYLNLYDIMSRVPEFPPDVWRTVEVKTIEPLAQLDRVEASDPEGTAFGYDLTTEEAQSWARGVYQQGHLYMFPAQASGRFPYSRVNYPARESDYIKPVRPNVSGVIAATNNHRATHPRMQIEVKEGKVSAVQGGGLYGELWRLLLNYPGTQELTWPYIDRPGYWWLYEAGTGTNPKYFKHPDELLEGRNTSERNVGGVMHWSFGAEVEIGPESTAEYGFSPQTVEFGKTHNVPIRHSMHNHNLLPTVQGRIRGTQQWETMINNGRIVALDEPEVRALASRYGDPEEILRQDYVPPLPGITIPGTYDDYGRDPGGYWTKWAESIKDRTYRYFKP